jgi:hypothetical protein
MTIKRRRMIFIPEVNPRSFVLFFEKGDTGRSWSIRDYSTPGAVTLKRPKDIGWDAAQIHQKAIRSFDAPTVRTDDLSYWHAHTQSCNARFLIGAGASTVPPRQAQERTQPASPSIVDRQSAFPTGITPYTTATELCSSCNKEIPSSYISCPYCLRAARPSGALESGSATPPESVHSIPKTEPCPNCGQPMPSTYISCPHCLRAVGSSGGPHTNLCAPPKTPSGIDVLGVVLLLFIAMILLGSVALAGVVSTVVFQSVTMGVVVALGVVAFIVVDYKTGYRYTAYKLSTGTGKATRRRAPRHRWLTNRLKPRRIHWGPRRLF